MNHKILEGGTNVVICTHVNPDGDAIGSSLALKHYLERKGKQATVVVPNVFPDFLTWLPGADTILIYTKHQEQIRAVLDAADLVIVCDLNQPNRLGGMEEVVMQNSAPRILIDHHSPALHLIQRIRDEAHRFAITYHRGLRGQASVHSALEDIPGVGPTRRRALLQYFKSVKAIKEADLEDLQKVPGMNAPAAQAVYAWAHPEEAENQEDSARGTV